ncbi:MAG: D-sedoheptulose-7-phosphate isomerase [Candidatus Odinarchaeia archaeon]
MYKHLIINSLEESISVKKAIIENLIEDISLAIEKILECIKNNNKILVFGNGGSAADAQHIAAELIGKFKKDRKALPAIALTTDTSILTSVGNDYEFENIFSRQIEGLAKKGDILLGISTSGNSLNVIEAFQKGKEIECFSIALLGKDGGATKDICDLPIIIPSFETPRIQEAHITIGHIICEAIEKELFK